MTARRSLVQCESAQGCDQQYIATGFCPYNGKHDLRIGKQSAPSRCGSRSVLLADERAALHCATGSDNLLLHVMCVTLADTPWGYHFVVTLELEGVR